VVDGLVADWDHADMAVATTSRSREGNRDVVSSLVLAAIIIIIIINHINHHNNCQIIFMSELQSIYLRIH